MNNFYNYIKDDIDIKREILKSMPDKNKSNIKNIHEKIVDFQSKYNEYLKGVNKYIEIKANSIDVSDTQGSEKDSYNQKEKVVNDLKYLRKILNPMNTYYEKLEFDALFYELSHYADYSFIDMNKLINKLFIKFEDANITLTANDFDATIYVNEYMNIFIEERKNSELKFTKLEPIFEKIYWVNPAIIDHINYNFRKLVGKYKNKLKLHLENLQEEHKTKTGVNNYEDCLKKLKSEHASLLNINITGVPEIINAAIDKKIDLNDYFPDSKLYTDAYNTLVVQKNSDTNENNLINDKLYLDIKKLKQIIVEYKNFVEFIPFIEYSKEMYKTYADKRTKKEMVEQISNLEKELSKINKTVMGDIITESGIKKIMGMFQKKEEEKPIKQLRVDSLNIADQLLELYKNVDSYKFYKKTKLLLDDYVTMDDFINLYYSFDYFKKKGLKNTFNTQSYEELLEYTKKFDEFSSNPNNLVITSVPIFQEYNVTKVIINKCRISNINLTEDNLKPSNIDVIVKHVNLFLDVSQIKKSGLTVEQLWFIVESKLILNKKK